MTAANDAMVSSHPPSDDTYVKSPLYYDEGDDHDNVNSTSTLGDKALLIQEGKKPRKLRKFRKKGLFQSLPSFILQKRLINLRSVLLAASLALILLVFWLLDSLKDPTFAIMVEGNLHKHQPLAKMASVGGTLILVILMEVVSNGRKNKQKKDMLSKEEIESGGGVWTKMDITSSTQNNSYNYEDDEDDGKIPISVFRTVGIAYIGAFGLLSYLISLHPDLRDTNLSDEELNEWKKHSSWYFLGYLQYVTIESYGSIAVATFWSFSNSTLTLKAAKKYYGFIIAMAQIGAIGGSSLATIQNISISRLFVVACVGIIAQITVMQVYGSYFPHPMNNDDDIVFFDDNDAKDYEDELNNKMNKARQRRLNMYDSDNNVKVIKKENENGNGMSKMFLSGVFLIMKYNYLLLILGVSCLYEVSLTCLDYEMKLIGLDRFSAPPDVLGDMSEIGDTYSGSKDTGDTFTIFMGRYGQLTNLLSLLLSYYLFPYLMENYGLKYTIRLFPSLLCLVIMTTFVALPMNLPVLFVSMSILKAMTYSINDPAKEILYLPTSNVVKFKAKFWIDVVGARIAKAVGSSINTYAGTAERIVQYGSFPSAATSVALWVVCYAAGMKFDELIEKGTIVGIEEDQDFTGDYSSAKTSSFDNDDEDTHASDQFINSDFASESGWESNVSVELIEAK